jgi:hypothetical protein
MRYAIASKKRMMLRRVCPRVWRVVKRTRGQNRPRIELVEAASQAFLPTLRMIAIQWNSLLANASR